MNVNGSTSKKPAEPFGIAVNQTTGDIYVLEARHKVIDQFTPGERVCGVLHQKLPSASAIAVDPNGPTSTDPSAGDVYVASEKQIFKFNSEGALLTKLKKFTLGAGHVTFGSIMGLAAKPSGELLVSETLASGGGGCATGCSEIARLSDAASNALLSLVTTDLGPGGFRRGLAVDSKGDFYAESVGVASNPLETTLLRQLSLEFEAFNPAGPAFAVVAELAGTGAILVPALKASK